MSHTDTDPVSCSRMRTRHITFSPRHLKRFTTLTASVGVMYVCALCKQSCLPLPPPPHPPLLQKHQQHGGRRIAVLQLIKENVPLGLHQQRGGGGGGIESQGDLSLHSEVGKVTDYHYLCMYFSFCFCLRTYRCLFTIFFFAEKCTFLLPLSI
jgi:hypothetical protein